MYNRLLNRPLGNELDVGFLSRHRRRADNRTDHTTSDLQHGHNSNNAHRIPLGDLTGMES